mgnify:CR=1
MPFKMKINLKRILKLAIIIIVLVNLFNVVMYLVIARSGAVDLAIAQYRATRIDRTANERLCFFVRSG